MVAVVTVGAGHGSLGAITNWSIQDDATPTILGTSSASVGDVKISAQPAEKPAPSNPASFSPSKFLDRAPMTLVDPTLGSYNFIADAPTVTDVSLDLGGAGPGNQMNIIKTAPPVYGSSLLSDAWNTYIGLCYPGGVTVNYTSSTNPNVAFPGWSANVWDMVNQLAAVYKQEIAFINGVITIRDINSSVLTLTDATADLVSAQINSQDIGLSVDVVVHTSASVSTLSIPTFNYATNPSMESNLTDWTIVYNAGTVPTPITTTGSITASSRATGSGTPYGSFAYSVTASETVGSIFQPGHPGIPYTHALGVTFSAKFIAFNSTTPSYFSMWIKVPAVAIATPSVSWYGVAGNLLGISSQSGVSVSSTTNVAMSVSSIPSGAVSGIYTIAVVRTYGSSSNTPGSSLTFFADGFIASALPLAYFDGGSAGASWSGTTNNSVSILSSGANASFYDALADNNAQYTVDVGQQVTTIIQTNNYPTQLAQPFRVTSFPITVGEYYVTAADNLPIPPGEWEAYGGNVFVAVGTIPGTIALTLTGPTTAIPGVSGPFVLAASDGTNNYAQLSIAGAGVTTAAKTITLTTGAPPTLTQATVSGPIDIPFLTSEGQARDRGAELTAWFSGPQIQITFRLSLEECAAFGLMQGSLVSWQYGIYRVVSVLYDQAGANVTAWMRVMDSDLTAVWSGKTDAQITAFWGGYTDAEIMEAPLWH